MLQGRVLVANRGEIAIRISRGAREAGFVSVVVYSSDDARALHAAAGDVRHELPGAGPAAYLDIDNVVAAARATGCDYVHPGYGFLSENADFARACEAAGLTFVGPPPSVLDLFGDKAAARSFAEDSGVPVIIGRPVSSTAEVRDFMAGRGDRPILIKAVAGGGGRGIRLVPSPAEIESAFEQCRAEAFAAFGAGDLYVEDYLPVVRHVEVQVVADRFGSVAHLWDRDCSVQRSNQKIIEIAPAEAVAEHVRAALWKHSVDLAARAGYVGVGTFEFLVWNSASEDAGYAFIEANARLQVEHTVTEMITGVDLVRTQLQVAAGIRLEDTDVWEAAQGTPAGTAVQVRVNAESLTAEGGVRPSHGTMRTYAIPSGPGIRVDGCGYAGYELNPRFDTLIAKIIAYAPRGGVDAAVRRARRALQETRIDGVATNVDVLWATLGTPIDQFYTRYLDEHRLAILERAASFQTEIPEPADLGDTARSSAAEHSVEDTENVRWMRAPTVGALVKLTVSVGDTVRPGTEVALVEAMKMQYAVTATVGGTVLDILTEPGAGVSEGQALVGIETSGADMMNEAEVEQVDLDFIRPDLAQVRERQARTLDAARSEMVEKRHSAGRLTAREIVSGLCDPDSFYEYGSLVVAARHSTTDIDALVEVSPADGIIIGTAQINSDLFGTDDSRAVVAAYDFSVYAGTQGHMNHEKTDRIIEIAHRTKAPLVFWVEGGGGRSGDTDYLVTTPETFREFAQLSGSVPLVGVLGGISFAGAAVLLGCCDVIIATKESTIGMGGPVMVEGGGLGKYAPMEIGPSSVQFANGVIDILAEDDDDAINLARRYLSYFQGAVADWSAADQRLLRHVVPQDRMRSYDMRELIQTLVDHDSFLELREGFGRAAITALVRIEGRPYGLIANNPLVLGGAIDGDAGDKLARFMQLCDAHGLPILSLMDTPGNMVGPHAEAEALVRRCCRPFVVGANLSVPIFAVLIRKAYGLGRLAMLGGSMRAPNFTIAWPAAEYGMMGLEGQVRLGFKRELEAIDDPTERARVFRSMVDDLQEKTAALRTATNFQIDEVIDPAETRRWIVAGRTAAGPEGNRRERRRTYIDTW